jgi:hypothetical protein
MSVTFKGGHWTFRVEGDWIENKGKEQSLSLFMYFSTEDSVPELDLLQKGQKKVFLHAIFIE